MTMPPSLMDEWREKKAREDSDLHERLATAIRQKRVIVYTDQRMLDFQGSPIHNSWDHIMPLLTLMCLALGILLATGVAIGIVAMTLGALIHVGGIKHFIAWRIRERACSYIMLGAAHLHQLWGYGGIALVLKDANEPPCLAPRADWRKFVRRNLFADPLPEENGPDGAEASPATAAPTAPYQDGKATIIPAAKPAPAPAPAPAAAPANAAPPPPPGSQTTP